MTDLTPEGLALAAVMCPSWHDDTNGIFPDDSRCYVCIARSFKAAFDAERACAEEQALEMGRDHNKLNEQAQRIADLEAVAEAAQRLSRASTRKFGQEFRRLCAALAVLEEPPA